MEYIQESGSTEVKVLCYKSEGRWFEPSLLAVIERGG